MKDFHWTQAIPWLIAAGVWLYNYRKDSSKEARDQEARIRALEVANLTDRLEQKHQLELMKSEVSSAKATVARVEQLLVKALE